MRFTNTLKKNKLKILIMISVAWSIIFCYILYRVIERWFLPKCTNCGTIHWNILNTTQFKPDKSRSGGWNPSSRWVDSEKQNFRIRTLDYPAIGINHCSHCTQPYEWRVPIIFFSAKTVDVPLSKFPAEPCYECDEKGMTIRTKIVNGLRYITEKTCDNCRGKTYIRK